MRFRRYTKTICLPLILPLPVFAWAWNARHTPMQPLSEQQALDRSQAICQTLAPNAGPLRLSVEPLSLPEGGLPDRVWLVECENTDGLYVARILLNRDTGDLQWCHRHLISLPPGRQPVPLDDREAIRAGGRALEGLGITQQASGWRLKGLPERNSLTWWTVWQAADRTAYVQVDALTGDPLSSKIVLARSKFPLSTPFTARSFR